MGVDQLPPSPPPSGNTLFFPHNSRIIASPFFVVATGMCLLSQLFCVVVFSRPPFFGGVGEGAASVFFFTITCGLVVAGGRAATIRPIFPHVE